MNEIFHTGLEGLITGMLGFVGWIGLRIVKKLDLIDKHEVKLQLHDQKFRVMEREAGHIRQKVEDLLGWTPPRPKAP